MSTSTSRPTTNLQGRWWSITCFDMSFNPDQEWFNSSDLSYIAGQKETCSSTSREHWQLVSHFAKKVRFNTVKSKFPHGSHIELSRSEAADEYVRKLETAQDQTYFSYGNKVFRRNSKTDWARQLQLARQGDIQSIDPDVQIRYYSTLKKIAADYAPPPSPLQAPCGFWIWGPPGYGKSHLVREWYPGLYSKNVNKWWDSYKGQKQVLLDDVSLTHKDWIGFFFKIWADKYPFQAEVKGGTIEIRPEVLVVTSNYSIEEMFAHDNALYEAINRRFFKIHIDKPRF